MSVISQHMQDAHNPLLTLSACRQYERCNFQQLVKKSARLFRISLARTPYSW
jgi:hypothetical protein